MTAAISFTNLIDAIYKLSFDERIEVKNLLEHNLVAARRDEFLDSYRKAKVELNSGKLTFSSDVNLLKKML